MLVAVTRAVSPSIVECELTHLARDPIDIDRASTEHAAYEVLLHSLGAKIVRATPAPALPDAVFVEDMAIVLDEIAVMTRPGAESRRPELAGIAEVVEKYRPLQWLTAPGTLDGGDVLRLGKRLYVGRSGRTNDSGIEQLRKIVGQFDYEVVPVDVVGCLHLKSAVTEIADNLVLINPAWVQGRTFPGYNAIAVDPAEPGAANAVRIAEQVVFPSEYVRTRHRLLAEGLRVSTTPCGELAKAEGAVTCCSLLFQAELADAPLTVR